MTCCYVNDVWPFCKRLLFQICVADLGHNKPGVDPTQADDEPTRNCMLCLHAFANQQPVPEEDCGKHSPDVLRSVRI